jgi:hypothetical protein
VDYLLTGKEERQPTKKRANLFGNSIFNFFASKDLFKKVDVQQKEFLEDVGLLIMENNLFIVTDVNAMGFIHLNVHPCT